MICFWHIPEYHRAINGNDAVTSVKTLNEVFSQRSTRRRYEVWFLRLGLASGEGAWWFRYLLMNPGRGGCVGDPRGMPVQVWATWFPRSDSAHSYIQGFPLEGLRLTAKGRSPFELHVADNSIGENFCRGTLNVEGHTITWDLSYRSSFHPTLSSKGWIGFSRTPHSDAMFSGRITLDGRVFESNPLGFGVQGHNCGYRHRNFWTWAHAYFPRPDGSASTLEALVYEMPLGLTFRRAILWHEGVAYVFRNLYEMRRGVQPFLWDFRCSDKNRISLQITVDGSRTPAHRVPYLKTDCRGSFPVTNNSMASATVHIVRPNAAQESLQTSTGAVLEIVG